MIRISIDQFFPTTGKKQVFCISPDTDVAIEPGQARPFKTTARVTREAIYTFPRLRKLLKPGHEACFTLEGTTNLSDDSDEVSLNVTSVQYAGAVNNVDKRLPSGKKLRQLFDQVTVPGYSLRASHTNQNRRHPKEAA